MTNGEEKNKGVMKGEEEEEEEGEDKAVVYGIDQESGGNVKS